MKRTWVKIIAIIVSLALWGAGAALAENAKPSDIVTDVGNNISISGSKTNFAGGTGVWGETKISYPALSGRVAGRVLTFKFTPTTTTGYFAIGLAALLADAYPTYGALQFNSGGVFITYDYGNATTVGTYQAGTTYTIWIITKSYGYEFYIEGGTYTYPTLLLISHIDTTSNLIPMVSSHSAGLSLDYVRTPKSLWQAVPVNGQGLLYNGAIGSAGYQIGAALSTDHENYDKHYFNPVIPLGSAGAWDDVTIKDPCVVYVNGVYYAYYTGWGSGGKSQVGLATSPDFYVWTKSDRNPVIPFAGLRLYHRFTRVYYDITDTDTTQRWKAWVTDSGGIYYYYSADGKTWINYGLVVAYGSDTWDAHGINPGCIYKSGATWYLYYVGQQYSTFSMGLATFTNPKSTYTLSPNNPILSSRSSGNDLLTADLMTGNKIVHISDTSIFTVNEGVWISKSVWGWELNRIASIDSPTQMTLRDNALYDHTVAEGHMIRSIYYQAIAPTSIFVKDGYYIIYGSAWGINGELSVVFKSLALDSGWTIDYDRGHFLPTGPGSAWDANSAENPSVVDGLIYPRGDNGEWKDLNRF